MQRHKSSTLTYLRPYWLFALLSPLAMIAEVYIDLLQPKLLANIIDNGVLAGNLPLIWQTGFTMLGLVLIGGICGAASGAFGSTAAQNFGNDLRQATFSKIMSMSHEQTDKFTTGSLVTRLTNDVTMMQETVNFSIRMVIRVLMQFVGGIIMMLTLNIRFGLVLLMTLPIQVIVIAVMMKKVVPLFQVVQGKLDKVNSVVQENVSGARVVKAYTREPHETERFSHANNDLVGTMLRVQKTMAVMMPVIIGIMYIATILILYIGGRGIDTGLMRVGDVMAASTYIAQILMSIMMIGFMIQGLTRAQASARRVREVLDTESVIKSGSLEPQRGEGTVEFRDVGFFYPTHSATPVLSDIDLSVAHGETLAILGATGCGKSTLVDLIPRFYEASSGTVLVDGVDVREYTLDSLRGRIGFVLQKSELFSGTVEENIRWGDADAPFEEVERAARIAQAHDFIMSFKDGYQNEIAEKGASLSGGQKQRLSIARALLKKPEILIFDDSMSALDLKTDAALRDALKHELKGTTVIKIAQRVASVMTADKIAVMENGQIVDCAPHDVLMQRCEIYKDIYDSQLGQGVSADE